LRGQRIQNRSATVNGAQLAQTKFVSVCSNSKHQLTENVDEQFAVDISRNERLVFEVADDPIPRKPDGGIDLERVTEIRVLRIEDYHGN
jgi:hypothetical protein